MRSEVAKVTRDDPLERQLAHFCAVVRGEAAPLVTLERVAVPVRRKQGELITGSAKEQAAKLVEKLRFEARAI